MWKAVDEVHERSRMLCHCRHCEAKRKQQSHRPRLPRPVSPSLSLPGSCESWKSRCRRGSSHQKMDEIHQCGIPGTEFNPSTNTPSEPCNVYGTVHVRAGTRMAQRSLIICQIAFHHFQPHLVYPKTPAFLVREITADLTTALGQKCYQVGRTQSGILCSNMSSAIRTFPTAHICANSAIVKRQQHRTVPH